MISLASPMVRMIQCVSSFPLLLFLPAISPHLLFDMKTLRENILQFVFFPLILSYTTSPIKCTETFGRKTKLWKEVVQIVYTSGKCT